MEFRGSVPVSPAEEGEGVDCSLSERKDDLTKGISFVSAWGLIAVNRSFNEPIAQPTESRLEEPAEHDT